MSVFRKAMNYLGLVDDDEYLDDEGYYDEEEYEEPVPAGARTVRSAAPVAAEGQGPVTVIRSRREREEPPVAPVVSRPAGGVRTFPMASARVYVMEPKNFNDAQEVGDKLKSGQPVILNLQGVDRDLQRRLIDFSSGLAYALTGAMSKAADQVFLLTPSNVEVSEEEKERLQARGLYRAPRS